MEECLENGPRFWAPALGMRLLEDSPSAIFNVRSEIFVESFTGHQSLEPSDDLQRLILQPVELETLVIEAVDAIFISARDAPKK